MAFYPETIDKVLSIATKMYTAHGAYKTITGEMDKMAKAVKVFNKQKPDSFELLANPDTRKIMKKVGEARSAMTTLSKVKEIDCPDYTKDVEGAFEAWSNSVDSLGVDDKKTRVLEKNCARFIFEWLNDLTAAERYMKGALADLRRRQQWWWDFAELADAMATYNEIVLKADFPDIAAAKAEAFIDQKDWKAIRSDAALIGKLYDRSIRSVLDWGAELKKYDKAAIAWQKSFTDHVKRAEKEGAK